MVPYQPVITLQMSPGSQQPISFLSLPLRTLQWHKLWSTHSESRNPQIFCCVEVLEARPGQLSVGMIVDSWYLTVVCFLSGRSAGLPGLGWIRIFQLEIWPGHHHHHITDLLVNKFTKNPILVLLPTCHEGLQLKGFGFPPTSYQYS